MHTTKTLLALASLAGYAAAASQWTVDKSCAAAYIAEACIGTVEPQITACGGNDWECLCNGYTTLLGSCYANCPNDPSITAVRTTILQYCTAYSATISTSVAPATSGTGSSSTAAASQTPSSTSSGGSGGSSPSPSSTPTPSSTGSSGTRFAVSPAGALAGFFAVAGAFL